MKTRLLIYLQTNKQTVFTIPQTVKAIDNFAFSHCNLETITIHDTVEKIGRFVFHESTLKSVSIGKNLETMDIIHLLQCQTLKQ